MHFGRLRVVTRRICSGFDCLLFADEGHTSAVVGANAPVPLGLLVMRRVDAFDQRRRAPVVTA